MELRGLLSGDAPNVTNARPPRNIEAHLLETILARWIAPRWECWPL